MTQKHVRRVLWIGCLIALSSCGRAPSVTGPSPSRSFLEGTWTGTITIDREGQQTSGPVSWTFVVVDGTDMRTFRVTISSQHAWLPINATVTSAIEPSNQPPARISTQGDYASPRGCTGSLLSVGTADSNAITADLAGVDCLSPTGSSTFAGRFALTKSR
ncbi:MAG: hypothetical protein AB7N65_17625 [Vicinamibacterales bacterium]